MSNSFAQYILTNEIISLCRAMENEKLSKKEKQMYLERSIAKHQEMFRGCMNAEGVDRHLFALFVACKGSNLVSLSHLIF